VIPDRVVTQVHKAYSEWGSIHAEPPDPTQALPAWIFVRDDGWALGARKQDAPHAFEAWGVEWVVVLNVGPDGVVARSLTPQGFLELCAQGELGSAGAQYAEHRGKRRRASG
jgi:hypothetical protein